MEEMHRTHKEVPFGWLVALSALLAARAPLRGIALKGEVSRRALDRVAMG